jgi:hypothetical protein
MISASRQQTNSEENTPWQLLTLFGVFSNGDILVCPTDPGHMLHTVDSYFLKCQMLILNVKSYSVCRVLLFVHPWHQHYPLRVRQRFVRSTRRTESRKGRHELACSDTKKWLKITRSLNTTNDKVRHCTRPWPSLTHLQSKLIFFNIHFNVILPSPSRSSVWSLSPPKFCMLLSLPSKSYAQPVPTSVISETLKRWTEPNIYGTGWI